MSANDRQVSGNHYKLGGEEHWDRMWRIHGRGYFVGSITKYVERYHLKNGIRDLEKAGHFIEKLIELEKAAASITTLAPRGAELFPEVNPSGWIGYTYEGTDANGALFTCSRCREHFRITHHARPSDFHDCLTGLIVSMVEPIKLPPDGDIGGAEMPTSAYVNQG